MRSLRHLIALTLGVAVPACSAEPTHVTPAQVLLYFDTDAPVPAGPDERRSASAPLFDRLRIDIYAPEASMPCADCSNDFEVNTTLFELKKVSVGIALPLHVSGFRARARLFKSEFASAAGEPEANSAIAVTVALPVLDGETIEERTVMLATDDLGPANARGSLGAPLDPLPGPPSATHVNTWSGALRTACNAAAPERAVCVPGGAYWMGKLNAPGFGVGERARSPRLVALNPFYLSATEVTVRQFRAAGIVPSKVWSGSREGATSDDWCTYASTPGPFEALPMNCVTVADARAYCASLGGDLPTEAQFEYVAGGLTENLFPWGRDEPSCGDAVFGRGGWGILANVESPCRVASPGGPAPAGQGARDRLDLPGGTIVDLAGNLSEWTRDTWNRLDEPCWSRVGIYPNPLCASSARSVDGPLNVYRGGNWAEVVGIRMLAPSRFALPAEFANINIGFRCVWAGALTSR